MKISLLLSAFVALLGLSFTTQNADFTNQHKPWELLGSRAVNYTLDRDEIAVTAREGVFTGLQIRVKRAPINLHKIVVHYGNGEVQEIETRETVRAGGSTRVIDLPGNKRVIQKVVFWYDTKNLAARKGEVQLWGRH